MKELDKYALRTIFESAHRMFLEKSGKEFASYENFLCYCIVKAFLSYSASKDWMIKNGKIYTSASEKTEGEE